MKTKSLVLFYLVCMCLSATHCFAQAKAAQLSSSFRFLGRSTVLNELMVLDPINPKLVVLVGKGSGEEIYVFSITGKQPRVIWHLPDLTASVEVIDPGSLQIRYTDDGPVITLHGCARHLCGGKGSAGALTYSIASGRMCSALASWNSLLNRADIRYSSPGDSLTDLEKSFLDAMLREEGY